ncbi:ATP-dependent DNA helicase [Halobacterium salinarum]|uniref:DNA excision repair protein ERCC-2 n=2 Tax=Halobacterium salinarum TaxID=2242 RepID=A0A4D6GQ17_HALS9|nr:DNA repair helicase Rad3 [Halobacterium salinarum]TYO82272.1 DNA excision repair protein ERCC-2 [Halobacterium salinarum DSM 3754]
MAARRDDTPDYMQFFPKPSPYDNQRAAMDAIRDALDGGTNVLFEGACGTGKTLAALAPALSHAQAEDKTVVITTNVHQQMRQFVREAREIHATEPIRAVVFKGKGSMCHIDVDYEECQVLRDNTHELVDATRDKRQLEERQRALLDEAQDGDTEAADARQAVMDELEAVESELAALQDGNVCERYRQNLVGNTDEFYQWLYDDVRTPEDIYGYAEEAGFCGYELLKDGIEGVDLAVCNYHHLLDPGIRAQFFRWLGRDPEDVVVVFDEAHNIEDAARDHAAETLTEQTLDSALDELQDTSDQRAAAAERVLGAFRDALVETYEDALRPGGDGPADTKSAVESNWVDVPVANDDRRDDLTLAFLQSYTGPGITEDVTDALGLGEYLDGEYEDAYRNGDATTRRECHVLAAAEFVEAYVERGGEFGQYPTAAVRRDDRTEAVYGRAERYTCIPREVTTDLFDAVHASVLMSATLRPFDVIGDVLGLDDPVELAFGLQFPEDRRRTFAVDTEPLFSSNREDRATQQAVAGALRDAAAYTPGNCLFFFPSYAEAKRYHDLLADCDATRYLDEPGVAADDLREAFVADGDGALFTSLWGTLAEGVSFDGDDARTVAVVGVPYPHLDARTEAVQDAYAQAFADRDADQGLRSDRQDAGWRYAVEIPTVRKTRQAMGRVIRSPEDFGVRMLVDRRYTAASRTGMQKYSVNPTFPPSERAEMVDVDPEKLRFSLLNFYGDLGAYGGDPPTP